MVVNKHGDRLYNGLIDTETRHLQEVTARIEEAQGESLLRSIKVEWDNHNKSVTMIRDILLVRKSLFTICFYTSSEQCSVLMIQSFNNTYSPINHV